MLAGMNADNIVGIEGMAGYYKALGVEQHSGTMGH